MPNKQFIPFAEINDRKNIIIVDGQHTQGLVLSHWKGANKLPDLEADTSGEIVLNAIQKNWLGLDAPYITATHFDIDGFVGVWALFNPDLAKKYDAILRQVAIIGDFRHFNPSDPHALEALKWVCWLNKEEKTRFYRPFGSNDELDDCVEKFEWFLPHFEAVLLDTEAFRKDWEVEYNSVLQDIGILKSNNRRVYKELGLLVIESPRPVHYYALMGDSVEFDMVMSLYEGNRYELEQKYTTWVDIASRPTLPRLDMQPLAIALNILETSGYEWFCDKITDTGPILRLEASQLSKADRYANPTEREIYTSSIPATEFEKIVVDFLRKGYSGVAAKKGWTWKEVKQF